jgi:hypothetical protein
MVVVAARAILAAIALSALLPGQTRFLSLADVKPGMRGTGRSVFSGDRVEDFQVEILGVLDNVGPRQSLILARLSGGPIARTGVMQGMSGSPVYIDGKLAGAVAMAFPYAKEPIAGIRPIEEMLRVSDSAAARTNRTPAQRASAIAKGDLLASLPRPSTLDMGDSKLIDIATPVSFSGFTQQAIAAFAPQLRALGLEPRNGVSGGGARPGAMGNPSRLEPGSMVSVQLLNGDMSIGADGTITHIDGNKVYAFGHRFLAVGTTDLPFARAEVIALLPSVNTSFKISAAREPMGSISQDRNTAVFGSLGRRAALVPLSIVVKHASGKTSAYRMEMVNDRVLSPFLMQMALFSAIDATERGVGPSSFAVKGEFDFQGVAPVRITNIYAGDAGSALQASLSAAIPLAYVLQGGFDNLQLRKVALEIESFDEKKQLQIDQVLADRREVHPGETVELNVTLAGENGIEIVRKVPYKVPIGAPAGPLFFTVADGNTTNMTDFRQVLSATPKSPAQLVDVVNQLRANTRAYVRAWRADPAFQLEGDDFPSPPPSVALVLAGSQSALAGISQSRNSKIAEMEIAAGEFAISGSKTIQVEVKE